jgi:hypothetical protein
MMLTKYYPREDVSEVAKLVGKSVKAVEFMAGQMGLVKDQELTRKS